MNTCRTCKHSTTSVVYPLLVCQFNDTYTGPLETCARWKSATVETVAKAFGLPEASLEASPSTGGVE